MKNDELTYVLGVDVLLKHRNIIQLRGMRPTDPNIDLSNAHLVMPEAVVWHLPEVAKLEPSEQGEGKYCGAAKHALCMLRELVEESVVTGMYDVCRLRAKMMVKGSNQLVSVLPVQKEILQYLPFRLSEDDLDDRIITTAVMAGVALANLNTEGKLSEKSLRADSFKDVVLLTSCDSLVVRARGYGIKIDIFLEKYD